MNKPKQYIQGYTEFYKLRFKVTPDVLIPRPETELLVDAVLEFIHSLNPKPQTLNPITVIDIGTGSGNIAVSLAKNTPNVKIIAVDISHKALKIAQQNAQLHQVERQITFLQSNLFDSVSHDPRLMTHDLPLILVANLPYIPAARIPYLDSSVKDFEPHLALDGGKDGFDLYRKLFIQIKEKELKPKLVVGEIDYTQGDIAYREAGKFFPNSQVEVRTDLAHKQRIILILNP